VTSAKYGLPFAFVAQVRNRLSAAAQILRANVGGCIYLPLSGRRGGRQLLQEPALHPMALRVSILASITIASQLAGNASLACGRCTHR